MMNNSGTPFSGNTKSEPESLAEANQTPGEMPSQPTEEELREKMVEVLRAARKGLTEDSIYAAVSLRHTIQVFQALEKLLLEGAIRAEVIDKKGDLSCNNFRYVAQRNVESAALVAPAEVAA